MKFLFISQVLKYLWQKVITPRYTLSNFFSNLITKKLTSPLTTLEEVAFITLRLSSLPSHCTSVSSRSLQAPAPVCRETQSAAALAYFATLAAHNPTTRKPPGQRCDPHHCTSHRLLCALVASCRSGLSQILCHRETLTLGRRCNPCETLALGRYCHHCKTLALGCCCHHCKTLVGPHLASPCCCFVYSWRAYVSP